MFAFPYMKQLFRVFQKKWLPEFFFFKPNYGEIIHWLHYNKRNQIHKANIYLCLILQPISSCLWTNNVCWILQHILFKFYDVTGVPGVENSFFWTKFRQISSKCCNHISLLCQILFGHYCLLKFITQKRITAT